MIDYEAQRQANLLQKQHLLEQLNLASSGLSHTVTESVTSDNPARQPIKKRKISMSQIQPTRTSARLAAGGPRTSYTENVRDDNATTRRPKTASPRAKRRSPSSKAEPAEQTPPPTPMLTRTVSLSDLLDQWNRWSPSAPQPDAAPSGTYYFESHPDFQPNKSPLDILLEGAFGGSYFSPWHSGTLNLTLEDDYLHTLPKDWLHELQPPSKYLISPTYNSSLNKYQVRCGQTLSEWEAAGWLNFEFDPRGWFEWYVRFFLGRRCDDDDRQVGRWSRCVGPKGRWKRMLLKKYIDMGVTSVYADEDDEDDQDRQVSPVMHQTCHHWAYEVRQEDLDEAWAERGRAF